MWDPTRRNRNIGTPKQGYGRNNKLTIPSPCLVSKDFYERLGPYKKIEKSINGHLFVFIIEQTRKSCEHACSIMDIERIIGNIPSAHYGSLKLIVLRQPKRKEEIISPVWGSLIYSYEFEGSYFPAIILEALDCNKKLFWEKGLSPGAQEEFARLKQDGHQFIENKKGHSSLIEMEKVRNTQLYRTLPHEFGHYVQYLDVVEKQGTNNGGLDEWNTRFELYLKIPKSEKEKFAHSYAEKLLEKLKKEGLVPFDRLSDIFLNT